MSDFFTHLLLPPHWGEHISNANFTIQGSFSLWYSITSFKAQKQLTFKAFSGNFLQENVDWQIFKWENPVWYRVESNFFKACFPFRIGSKITMVSILAYYNWQLHKKRFISTSKNSIIPISTRTVSNENRNEQKKKRSKTDKRYHKVLAKYRRLWNMGECNIINRFVLTLIITRWAGRFTPHANVLVQTNTYCSIKIRLKCLNY